MTCEGRTGTGPCERTATYFLIPAGPGRRKPTQHACGQHLAQLLRVCLRGWGATTVSPVW